MRLKQSQSELENFCITKISINNARRFFTGRTKKTYQMSMLYILHLIKKRGLDAPQEYFDYVDNGLDIQSVF
ncbi:hypothetical protein Avbf_17625 [Armadillidium vulgare]|nr:hypothetical protein Avbf_17625 [Armadillidium vulgare]